MGVHGRQVAYLSLSVVAVEFTLPPYFVPERSRSAVSLTFLPAQVPESASMEAWNHASCSGVEMSSVPSASFYTWGTRVVGELPRGSARPALMVAEPAVRSACFARMAVPTVPQSA